jgi:hypothetical protein
MGVCVEASVPPDAAQRVALREAVRCRAGVPVSTKRASSWVPALRSGMKNAAPRPGHETYFPIITRNSVFSTLP